MNQSILVLVAVVAFAMVAQSNCAGIINSNANILEKISTAQDIQGKILVTPYGYKQVLLQSGETKVNCWICNSPCSNTICCDDGWPQCCIWNGLCGCCSI